MKTAKRTERSFATDKYLVGLTGGIGSGKSVVRKIFETLHIDTYDADQEAKALMINDAELIDQIKEHFGNESYDQNGILNRQHLANIVFNDPRKTKLINSIVHPAVQKHFITWVEKTKSPFIIKEAALMIETRGYKQMDFMINVSAPMNLRVERILKRDPQRSREQIISIINKQINDIDRKDACDITLLNDEKSLLLPKVIEVYEQIKGESL